MDAVFLRPHSERRSVGGTGVTSCCVDEPLTERVVDVVLLRNSSRRRRFGKKIAVTQEMSDSAGFWHMRR